VGLLFVIGIGCDATSAGAPETRTSEAPQDAVPVVCGPMTVSDPSAAILTFKNPAGACISPGRLVHYRCGSGADPVIELDARTGHGSRFLGGRFAVPVVEVPKDAVPVAHARGVSVSVTATRPARVYVDQEGGVTRWLPLPGARAVSQPPNAFLLGDSILYGSQTFVAAALPKWTTTFDAVVGRPSASGVSIAAAEAAAQPDVAVVELGTNDGDAAGFRRNADAILTSFAGVPLVVWVTVHSPAASAPEINRQIRLAAAAAPNVALADWKTQVPATDLSPDGIHLSPGHEGVFAQFLAPLLLAWIAAVRGHGAARCSAAIDAAVRG
jgi:hypothetical protein